MDETWKAEDKDVKSTRDVLKKWNDYYINNNFGIGIQCDKCRKWRKVFQYEDQSEVPEVWICSMWKMDGHRRGSCRIPSDLNEDHFAEALYSPGTLVWAKCPGYPWWPAMIEDCPDVQHYFIPYVDSEHEYHVNFFGKKPLRNWITASFIKDFSTPPPMTPKAKKSKDLQRSIEQANEALKISPKERLKKYSFAVRYKGRWAKVKELDKVDLPPNCLKRKIKEESTDLVPPLVAEEPHANRNCDRTSTVRKVRKGKSKSETATKRKSVDNEIFQSVQQSTEPQRTEFAEDPEKEENSLEEDSSEFRPQLKAEAPHVNQDCHHKSSVRKLKNVKPKSKAATKRKSVKKEEFRPVLQSVGAISESSSESEKEENSEEQDSSGFRSQVIAKEPHFNQDYPSTLTVWEVRNAKSKAKTATNRESVDKEKFHPVRQSVGASSESSSDSEKEENSEEENSSESEPHVMPKKTHFNQDCPSTLTVWKVRNAKSKAVTNRKSVDKEGLQPVLQSVKAISGSSSDSEKEENSSEIRPQVMDKEPHFNQDCPSTLTVWKVRNAKSKPEDAIKRKFVHNEKFQTVQQSIKHKGSEYSDKEENSEAEDLSETRSPVTAESTAFRDSHCISTVREVEGKSEDTTKRKLENNEEYQSVQRFIKHKRSECSTESEKEESEEDSPFLKNSTPFSDGEEGDSSVLNNNTILSDSEEEESHEVKAYAEGLKKKHPPVIFLPDTKLLSVNGTGGNFSHRSSQSTIHYRHEDNFSEKGSIICHENAAELENDTVIHNGSAVENSQNDSDASLLRTQYPSCCIPKNEQFSDRSERLKKNRERIRKLINSNNSKYAPYSFLRGRMKK